jgi:DNA polymerase (family 10)
MDNPHFTILGHPTGRMIQQRRPYELDMEWVMKAAKERGCLLELNAHPERLDLNDVHCKMDNETGIRGVISTDAHRVNNLDFIQFGVGQAKRGCLGPEDVINTRNSKRLRKLLKRN